MAHTDGNFSFFHMLCDKVGGIILQPLRSSCRRRPYMGASTVKTTALYPVAGHQIVNIDSLQFVTMQLEHGPYLWLG